jgi:tRNA pseudouridine synthase 9
MGGHALLSTAATSASHRSFPQEEVKTFDYVYTPLFRVVPPYRFEFGTSIKERWIGRPLVEVFSQEFPYFTDSVAYYTDAMTQGRLRVNDEITPLEYRCRDGDVITHIVHRRAPPAPHSPCPSLHLPRARIP